MEELAMSEAAIQAALDASSIFMQNQEERLAYLNREMAILDYESDKAAIIDERQVELALDMLRNNEQEEKIVKYSHLTLERIRELAQQVN